jgi:hypothetical protein
MVALANLYTILDVSIQQLAVGLAILPSLVALAWYVSHPIHRRRLSATVGSDARGDERVVGVHHLVRAHRQIVPSSSLSGALRPRASFLRSAQ